MHRDLRRATRKHQTKLLELLSYMQQAARSTWSEQRRDATGSKPGEGETNQRADMKER